MTELPRYDMTTDDDRKRWARQLMFLMVVGAALAGCSVFAALKHDAADAGLFAAVSVFLLFLALIVVIDGRARV